MIFLSNLRVKRILCSFILVLEEKADKEIHESSRLEILENISTKSLSYQMQEATHKTH